MIDKQLYKGFKLEPYETLSELERVKGEINLINYAEKIGVEVPKEYLEIVGESTGYEIGIGDNVYIRIWDAEWCVEMNDAYAIPEFSPNSLAIGDDEGGKFLIYLVGDKGYGLYLSECGNLGSEEAEFISKTLTDFLLKGGGVNTILYWRDDLP